MKKNIGPADLMLRIVLTLLLATIAFSGTPGPLVLPVLVTLTGYLLITCITGTCPLYRLFGYSTVKKEKLKFVQFKKIIL